MLVNCPIVARNEVNKKMRSYKLDYIVGKRE